MTSLDQPNENQQQTNELHAQENHTDGPTNTDGHTALSESAHEQPPGTSLSGLEDAETRPSAETLSPEPATAETVQHTEGLLEEQVAEGPDSALGQEAPGVYAAHPESAGLAEEVNAGGADAAESPADQASHEHVQIHAGDDIPAEERDAESATAAEASPDNAFHEQGQIHAGDDTPKEIEQQPEGEPSVGSNGDSPAAASEEELDEKAPGGEFMQGFFEDLLKALGVQGSVSVRAESQDEVTLDIRNCPDASLIIGRHGQTVDDLQYLGSLVLNNNRRERRRFMLNVENYREHREETLRQSAIALARQVAELGQEAVLDPLPPHERRIVHMALEEVKEVYTYSEGVDAERRIVISPRTPVETGGGSGIQDEATADGTGSESDSSIGSPDNSDTGNLDENNSNMQNNSPEAPTSDHDAEDSIPEAADATSQGESGPTGDEANVEKSDSPEGAFAPPPGGSVEQTELDPTEFGLADEEGPSESGGENKDRKSELDGDEPSLPPSPPGGGSHDGHTGED